MFSALCKRYKNFLRKIFVLSKDQILQKVPISLVLAPRAPKQDDVTIHQTFFMNMGIMIYKMSVWGSTKGSPLKR